MDHTEIANRFAAFFGGRPVGEKFLVGMQPEQVEREQERDREILAYVAEVCGTPEN